ncbi:Tat (twin-arginine translocation) pathway signal sequence [Chitinophaga jiangningensis]|uniref:Tat (Twin-arginine translocation) pathway signal sequence n=1 Tax=Chitinophaga jiangningensis TaxID=1419482 RepID=A0A1M7L8L6_9BACT|nr:sugar phosphate isomerase/epimerase [Chitinophaga jiangningensis]SHM74490.1 Tat (twin-arginine translocation) pathway signal sequence [Chitinophaga jiangningensis]
MNSRRDFIKQAALVSAGALLLPSIASAKSVKTVGLQLYTLRDLLPKDPEGVIRKVAAIGYKEVETYGYNPKTGFWGMPAKQLAQVLKSTKLVAPSGHVGVDPFIRDGNTDDLKANIEALKTIGATYFTVPYLDESLRQSADDYKKVAEKLNKAAELCKASGLRFAYHNHDFEFKQHNGVTGYSILLKETDPKLVSFELDIFWAVHSGQQPDTIFAQHPGRFPMWHVKDMDKANPGQNTEVGKGSIDFKEIFTHASTAGLKHFYVEHENNYQPDELGSIATSFNYIRKNIK